MKPLIAAVCLVSTSVCLHAGPLADSIREITLPSLVEDVSIQPLKAEADSCAVVIFTTTDCPIANAYAPELARLQTHIEEAGGKLTLIHVDPVLSVEDALKHATDYSLNPAAIVIDRDHAFVAATDAEITPEAVLVSSEGEILYQGRINNLFADFGDRRRVVSQHDLRDAFDATMAGEKIEVSRVEPIGCYIPQL